MTPNTAAFRGPASIVDEELGLVRWVAEVPQDPSDPMIFNYSVKMADTGEYLPLLGFQNNGGAGLTREHAYRAALGEAVERYCSSVFFKEDVALKTWREASRQCRALAPGEISLFHPVQRENIRYAWFEPDTKICWTGGYSVTRNEPVLIPASLVFIPYYPFHREDGEEAVGPGISTGQASGYNDVDAMLSGLYEIIERDAFSILWLNRMAVPKIDIESSPSLAAIYGTNFKRKGLECTLFDMTSDIGVPSVLCVMIDHGTEPPMICTGGATNSSAERAAVKALVEAAQTRQWARYLGRTENAFIVAEDYSNIDDFEKHVFLYGHCGMMRSIDFLRSVKRTVPLSHLPSATYKNRREELAAVRAKVEAKGYEVIVADLTSPDVAECGYRVLKTIVPQMQHLEGDHNHRFLGCERLYTVPPLLGHPGVTDPLALNTDPHPYP